MKKGKDLVGHAGIVLLILTLAFLYQGVRGISAVRPVTDYEDKGIHTFAPDRVWPTQVENTSSGQDKRLYPTKTVYMVHYKAVDRRVLSIKETGRYITVQDRKELCGFTQSAVLSDGGAVRRLSGVLPGGLAGGSAKTA